MVPVLQLMILPYLAYVLSHKLSGRTYIFSLARMLINSSIISTLSIPPLLDGFHAILLLKVAIFYQTPRGGIMIQGNPSRDYVRADLSESLPVTCDLFVGSVQ